MKPLKIPLRRRVLLACVALGFVLSVLFAGSTLWTIEASEHILVDAILRDQIDDYRARLAADPAAQLPHTSRLTGYLLRPGGTAPSALLDLPPGVHDGDVDGTHVGIYDTPQGRIAFVIDLGGIEALERYALGFMAGVIVLGTLAGAWIGRLLAGMTIQPVRRLAAAVDALPARPAPTQFEALAADDELGRLARAIDAYQVRLMDADAAERRFYADASHELRTPIAVMRGAAEVLLDDADADVATRRRLQRLDRGLSEVTDLLEAMLGMARQRAYTSEDVELAALLHSCAPAATDALHVDVSAHGHAFLPRNEATLVLRGVLRRVLPPEPVGHLSLRADGAVIEVTFAPAAAGHRGPTPAPPDAGDRGLGLTLVGRLAERLGWQLETLVQGATRGVRIRCVRG